MTCKHRLIILLNYSFHLQGCLTVKDCALSLLWSDATHYYLTKDF